MASHWYSISPMTRPLNLEILEITPLSLTVSLSLAAQPRWVPSSTSAAAHTDLLIHGQQQFGVPAAKQRKSRSKGGQKHVQGNQGGGTGGHDSEEELTAVEDNGDGPSHHPHGHVHHHQSTTAASPYTSSSLPGSYPRRLPLSSTHPDAASQVPPSFKELLSKGIVVTVNGNPWNRIVAHVSDDDVPIPTLAATNPTVARAGSGSGDPEPVHETDEQPPAPPNPASFPTPSLHARTSAAAYPRDKDRAIVVVYGLEPGKEYEVDLKILGQISDGEANVTATTSVTTPAHHATSTSGTRSRANSLRSRPQAGRSRSSSLIQSVGTQAGVALSSGSNIGGVNPDSGGGEKVQTAATTTTTDNTTLNGSSSVIGGTWTAPGAPLSANDVHANNLRHLVTTANMQREELAAQLKKSRRESQKAEAALRSEVEALKRATEKTALPDLRSRQKSLALQEQVKQAFHAAAEAERECEDIQRRLDEWREEEEKVGEEWTALRSARNAALEQKATVLESEKKALTELDAQLGALKTRVTKQTSKREKLQHENAELRQKLESVASARREVEKRNEAVRQQQFLVDDYSATGYGGRAAGGGSGYWDPDGLGSGWNPRSGMLGMRQPEQAYGMTTQEDMSYNPAGLPGAFPRSRQGSVAAFQPRAGGSSASGFLPPSRPNSMAASANSAAAALATQGIPRSATAGISHLGNPTGFFASAPAAQGPVPSTQMTARGMRASLSTNVSPMMANVTAAPFMPASTQFSHSTITPSPPASQHEHTTSLVPPQLQHRIYLPGNRGRNADGNASISPLLATSSISPAVSRAEVVASDHAPNLSAPSFPPLPSQANTGTAAHGQKAPPGPSLASIVTRAIIPPNSTLMHSNQLQKSPGLGSDEHSPTIGTRNPTATGRPLSWMARTEPLDRSSRTTSPAQDDFPVLSPAGSWAAATDHGRQSGEQSVSGFPQSWGTHRPTSNPSQNHSRRGSLAAVHERESEAGL